MDQYINGTIKLVDLAFPLSFVILQGDYNVIIVGWGIGAAYYFYPRSASDTRTVGGEIALISNNTIKRGKSSRAMMYCVGHSLGAQACGHAGMQGQFGRITGKTPNL